MTSDTVQQRSIIASVWQEISSLWSGVDFSFSDSLSDLAEQTPQPRIINRSDEPYTEINHGNPEPCW